MPGLISCALSIGPIVGVGGRDSTVMAPLTADPSTRK